MPVYGLTVTALVKAVPGPRSILPRIYVLAGARGVPKLASCWRRTCATSMCPKSNNTSPAVLALDGNISGEFGILLWCPPRCRSSRSRVIESTPDVMESKVYAPEMMGIVDKRSSTAYSLAYSALRVKEQVAAVSVLTSQSPQSRVQKT